MSEIKGQGGESIFVGADVTSATDVEAMVNRTVEAYGRLDYGFNNAGVNIRVNAPIHEYPEDDWDRGHRGEPQKRVVVHEIPDSADA